MATYKPWESEFQVENIEILIVEPVVVVLLGHRVSVFRPWARRVSGARILSRSPAADRARPGGLRAARCQVTMAC